MGYMPADFTLLCAKETQVKLERKNKNLKLLITDINKLQSSLI
jgi:hypothetical protein